MFVGRYPLCGQGRINSYSVFAETMRSLIAPTGRAGITVPTGIATDDTTKEFFADLVAGRSLASLYDFENAAPIFVGVHRSYKFSLLTIAGRERPVQVAEFVFFAFVHDITARKQAEEERDRFFTLSLDMVCVAGFDGYFKRVNPSFERILGYTRDEMLAKPWLDFVHAEDQERTRAEGDKIKTGALSLHFENRYRCKDGTYKWLAWTSVPVASEGRIYAISCELGDEWQFG